jgi:hypothetical protein
MGPAGYVKRPLKIAEISMPPMINKQRIKSSDYEAGLGCSVGIKQYE